MASNKNNSAKSGKGSGNGGKGGNHFFPRKSSYQTESASKRKYIPGLPVLRYGANTNFEDYRREMSLHALQSYKNLGRLFRLNAYYVAEELVLGVHYSEEDLDDPLILARLKTESNEITRENLTMKQNRVSLFADMWGQLDNDSQDVIKRRPNYAEDLEAGDDPLALWQAIQATHMIVTTGTAILDQRNARNRYNLLVMSAKDSIVAFKEMYDQSIACLRSVNCTLPTDEEQAVDFLEKLDSGRYLELRKELTNNLTFGIGNYPTNLAEAYLIASRYKVIRTTYSHHGAKGSSSSATDGSHIQESVFLTEASKKFPSKNNKGKGKGKKPDNETDNANKKGKVKCYNCQNFGHYANKCPQKKSSADQEDVIATTTTSMMSSMTVPPAFVNGEDDDIFTTFATLTLPETTEDSNVVCAAMIGGMSPNHVLLDNQATRSIFSNDQLCDNIRHTGTFITFRGVGGGVSTDLVGDVADFGTVSILHDVGVNIISLKQAEQRHKVTYQQGKSFTVEVISSSPTSIRKYVFYRQDNGLYMADFSPVLKVKEKGLVFVEVASERASHLTKSQLIAVNKAREVSRMMAYPSNANLMKLSHGHMLNMPVTAHDIYRSHQVYGPEQAAVQGKNKLRTPKSVVVEHVPRPIAIEQVLHADLMFLSKSDVYLISVSVPLYVVMASWLNGSKGVGAVRKGLNHQLKQYRARSFEVKEILCDREGALHAMKDELANTGIVINPTGKSHVPLVEVRNRVIKERFRGIITNLPYELPLHLHKFLVYFVLNRMNMMPCSSRVDTTSPREMFTGRKVDFKRDVRIGFGDYVHIDTHMVQRNNPFHPRTLGAIALEPQGNLQGSVRFFVIEKGTTVIRDQWVPMVMPPEAISKMNEIAKEIAKKGENLPVIVTDFPPSEMEESSKTVEKAANSIGVVGNGPLMVNDASRHLNVDNVKDPLPSAFSSEGGGRDGKKLLMEAGISSSVNKHQESDEGGSPDDNQSFPLPDDDVQKDVLSASDENISGENIITNGESNGTNDIVNSDNNINSTHSMETRFKGTKHVVHGNKRSNYAFSTLSLKEGIVKHKGAAVDAATKELRQMYDQGVFKPVKVSEIKKGCKVIGSFMFLKEKYLPNGEFDKLKMRLVAGGNWQNRLDYDDLSSPTVSIVSVLAFLALCARGEWDVATVDITGAYLNAKMKADVFMRLDPRMAEMMCEIDSDYRKFLRVDGSMVVKLVKALYGCIESAKLWFEVLVEALLEYGLVQNEVDPCVFHNHEKNFHVAIYVDDILVTSPDNTKVDKFLAYLRERFKTITEHRGHSFSYLGMSVNVNKESKVVYVEMQKYVEDLLNDFQHVNGCSKTPALSDLFTVDHDSALLNSADAKSFHSTIARILYLAKRIRPDLLTSISFLATRVKAPTEEDQKKLLRVIRYIKGSKNVKLTLKAEENLVLKCYVDASHATHSVDGKSHTGLFVTLGSGPIFYRSTKQKLVSKSSTEAELVGLSDCLPMILWIKRFLVHQGFLKEDIPALVFEDNQSTIALVARGRPAGDSTRHIDIRYFFIKDKVASKELRLQYLSTDDMIADFFTKPLQGGRFKLLRNKICGYRVDDNKMIEE